jgi:hypothetical protein
LAGDLTAGELPGDATTRWRYVSASTPEADPAALLPEPMALETLFPESTQQTFRV